MSDILRNLILAVIGIVVVTGLVMAGLVVGAALLGVGALSWVLLKLYQKGIINPPTMQERRDAADPQLVTDAEYEVMSVQEERERKDRV